MRAAAGDPIEEAATTTTTTTETVPTNTDVTTTAAATTSEAVTATAPPSNDLPNATAPLSNTEASMSATNTPARSVDGDDVINTSTGDVALSSCASGISSEQVRLRMQQQGTSQQDMYVSTACGKERVCVV